MSRFPQDEVPGPCQGARRMPGVAGDVGTPEHGGPAFFVRDKKCFVMFLNDHHGDGRYGYVVRRS